MNKKKIFAAAVTLTLLASVAGTAFAASGSGRGSDDSVSGRRSSDDSVSGRRVSDDSTGRRSSSDDSFDSRGRGRSSDDSSLDRSSDDSGRRGVRQFFSGLSSNITRVFHRSESDDNGGRRFLGIFGNRVDNSGPGSVNSSRNATLVRGDDGRVFAVNNGFRTPVRTIADLNNRFSGVTIQNLNSTQLRNIPIVSDDNSFRIGDDNLPRHSGLDDFGLRGRRGGEIGGGRSFDD